MKIERTAVLGRTGLRIGRLALSAGYGIGAEGVREAFDHGVNLFYWGSTRRAEFGRALAEIAATDRDKVVIALQSYSRSASLMHRSIERALRQLKIEYADLLILGFWNGQIPRRISDAALELKSRGRVRFLCVSTHKTKQAGAWANSEICDALMVRYNPTHREIENDLFPQLHSPSPPGIVSFTSTRWGHLLDPKRMPPGEPPLTAKDCYRYALRRSEINATFIGPRNRNEIREALAALDSDVPDENEIARMNRIGDYVRDSKPSFYTFGQ